MTRSVAAVDLGATSGRVMVGHVGPNERWLESVARFANGGTMQAGSLRWNASGLLEHAVECPCQASDRTPAIGNVLIQARTPGAVDSTLEGMRNLVRNTFSIRKYLPKEPLR